MTETHGFMCPKCLSWWTVYLNKDGKIYCGCDVPQEEWVYIYRKTYGNSIFGIADKVCKVGYKGVAFRIDLSDVYVKRARDSINKHKLKKLIRQQINDQNADFLLAEVNLIYIAFKKAMTQASGKTYIERCPRCHAFRGARTCECGHDWKTCDCQDFGLKASIKEFLVRV